MAAAWLFSLRYLARQGGGLFELKADGHAVWVTCNQLRYMSIAAVSVVHVYKAHVVARRACAATTVT